jgi:hypothetical protein
MPPHKFKVGDIVFVEPALSRNVPGGVFEVTKQLPGISEPKYRIKSANEEFSGCRLTQWDSGEVGSGPPGRHRTPDDIIPERGIISE